MSILRFIGQTLVCLYFLAVIFGALWTMAALSAALQIAK